MISVVGSLSKGWLAKELSISFDRDYYFDLNKRYEVDFLCHKYVREQLSDLVIFYTESNLGQFQYFSDNQILVGGIQPNMILGMLIGADFIPHNSMVPAKLAVERCPFRKLYSQNNPFNYLDFL